MDNYNYPLGSDDSSAPWNKDDIPEREVTVTLILSKTVKVTSLEEDISSLMLDVENQVVLPSNLANYVETLFEEDLDLKAAGMPRYLKEAIKDCKDWTLDDFEITL